MTLADLRARLKALDESRTALKAQWKTEDGDKREPTAEELAEVNANLDEREHVIAQIETLQREERAAAAAAAPIVAPANAPLEPLPGVAPAQAETDSGDPMLKLGKLGFIAANRRRNPTIDVPAALTTLGEGRLAAQVVAARPASADIFAATSTGAGSGADLVPQPLMEEIIPLLFADSAFMAARPTELPLTNGNLTIPKGATKPTATWGAEGANITASDVTFGGIQLIAKILRIMTPVQNTLLAYAVPSTFNFISNAIRETFAESLDIAGIRADGTGDTPEGLLSLAAPANVFAAAADPGGESEQETAKRIENDLRAMIMKLTLANIPMRRCSWLMNPNVAAYIGDLKTEHGTPYFPGMDAAKGSRRLKGYPVQETTQIPINLGAGTDESEVYFAEFGNVYYGVGRAMAMSISDQASYWDGSELQSAFDRDQTVLRAISEVDFDLSYPEAAAVLTGVTWGS